MSHHQDDRLHNDVQETEVAPKAQRRKYSREYKRRILDEIEACTRPGQVGAILRREGLYSQIVSKWRKQFRRKGQAGLESQKRGPKTDPQAAEIKRLKRENELLRKRLEQAEMIIDVQKKVSQMLGLGMENNQDDLK